MLGEYFACQCLRLCALNILGNPRFSCNENSAYNIQYHFHPLVRLLWIIPNGWCATMWCGIAATAADANHGRTKCVESKSMTISAQKYSALQIVDFICRLELKVALTHSAGQ